MGKNRSLISRRWPDLAMRLDCTKPDENFQSSLSRSGLWVLHMPNGPALHSLYAPEKESERFCQSCNAESILFLGFGCGYQLWPFLNQPRFQRFLVLESSLCRLKTVLAHVDQSQALADERLELAILDQREDFLSWFSAHYHPIWHGQLVNYPLRSIVDREAEYFRSALHNFGQYIDLISGDLSSQAFFAKTWFRNILVNLQSQQPSQCPLKLSTGCPVVLAGAGPSLEAGIEHMAELQYKGHFLIACDAALRPLLYHGIKPDLVVSLDAQALVYRHFVGVKPGEIQLLCDIVSPPALVRQFRAHFFAGGHPLGRLSGLASLDTQGGNVGYAALALAKQLSSEITYYGFDFCFPQAKAYACDVYVYPEFLQTTARYNTYENAALSLVFRYQHLQKEKNKGILTYTPELFLDYHRAFQNLLQQNIQPQGAVFSPVKGKDFVQSYRQKVLALNNQAFHNPQSRYNPILITLAPLVSSFMRDNLKIHQAWALAIEWAQDFLKNRI